MTAPPANEFSLATLKPDLSNLPALNLLASIAFAFAGLELASTMADEVENPRRNLPRSIFISAPLIAVVYVIGTAAVLWRLPNKDDQRSLRISAGDQGRRRSTFRRRSGGSLRSARRFTPSVISAAWAPG